jgi:hypothetical protein
MTRALVRTHGYLDENRGLIVSRSLAAAIAGSLPVPLVEEWLAAAIRRGMIRSIAEKRGVDAEPPAIRTIADGATRPPEWTEIAGGGLLYRVLRGTWRRLLIAFLVARRAQAASHTFVIGTLFDHYCSKLHVGLGLNAVSAAELRALMDEAIRRTPGGVARQLFRRGVVRALRTTVNAPVNLANLLTAGGLRKLLSRGEHVEAEAEVDRALERQLEANDTFLSRATAAVEVQLTAEANPYLNDVISLFETLWRDQQRRAPIP